MKIISLHNARELELVGGKAVNLGSLIRASVNVPDGFVIPTYATNRWSDNLSMNVLKYFDALKCTYVAVRSSATAEDSNDKSWAGQFDTFLFVKRDQLIDKVKQCIGSAASKRSNAYRDATMHNETPKIAVIIQAMIPADVSGVGFSVHPVIQKKDQLVIESAYGLGESVVSGEITPDNYVVSRPTHNILSKNIADQKKQLIYSQTKNGATWEKIDHAEKQKLNDQQIKKLALLIEHIEKHFGYPVDVEWTLHKNTFYILQCRPITTLR